jgi:hypothetical protein
MRLKVTQLFSIQWKDQWLWSSLMESFFHLAWFDALNLISFNNKAGYQGFLWYF